MAEGPTDALCQSNLVNCCRTVGTSCTTNRSNSVSALQSTENYERGECITPTVQPRCGDRRKCSQQARPSMTFVDSTIGKIFYRSLRQFKSEVPLFWRCQLRIAGRKRLCQNELDASNLFDTLPAWEGQMGVGTGEAWSAAATPTFVASEQCSRGSLSM